MKVKDIMTKDPAFCEPQTDLRRVAKMMCDQDCGEIPVVDNSQNRKPIGVITDRDIVCRAVAEGKNPLNLTAKDCMTQPATVVQPEMSIEECCELLQQHQIRRVPVVDEKGRCCGIVSQADVALRAGAAMTYKVLTGISAAERSRQSQAR